MGGTLGAQQRQKVLLDIINREEENSSCLVVVMAA